MTPKIIMEFDEAKFNAMAKKIIARRISKLVRSILREDGFQQKIRNEILNNVINNK